MKNDMITEQKLIEVGHIVCMMTNDQLNELVDVIKYRRNVLKKQAMKLFKAGNKVWFHHKNEMVTGIVHKVIRTRIQVTTDIGGFSCTPTLLKHSIGEENGKNK